MKDPLKPIDKHIELVFKWQTEEVLEVLDKVFFELLIKVRWQLLDTHIIGVFKVLCYFIRVIIFRLKLLLIFGYEGFEFLSVFFQKLHSPLLVLLIILSLPFGICLLMLSVVEPSALFVKELVCLDEVMFIFSLRFVISYLSFWLRWFSLFRSISLPGN